MLDDNQNLSMFEPLEKQRYSDKIVALIKGKIFARHMETGTRLPSEIELSQEFKVSRSVVREALRILETTGLVRIKKGPTGGIFVSHVYNRPITTSLSNLIASGEITIDHLFEVRQLLEPHIACEAALNASKEDLKELKDLILDSTENLDDPVLLKRNNLKFHLLLAKASGNPLFSLLLESVIELLIERSLDFLDLSLEKGFYQIHKQILHLIENRQADAAAELVRTDILDVRNKLKSFKVRRNF